MAHIYESQDSEGRSITESSGQVPGYIKRPIHLYLLNIHHVSDAVNIARIEIYNLTDKTYICWQGSGGARLEW